MQFRSVAVDLEEDVLCAAPPVQQEAGGERISPSPGSKSHAIKLLAAEPKEPISAQQQAFLQLFYMIDALRTAQAGFAVQFVGANQGAGVTTVATGYASAAAAIGRGAVLVIDTAPGGQPGLLEAQEAGRPLDSVTQKVAGCNNLFCTRLSGTGIPFDSDTLKSIFQILQRSYSILILDSLPVGASPASVALSRACDGTVLVIGAGRTRADAALSARTEITRGGGQIIGLVFNGSESHLPGWIRRWF